MGAEEVAGEGVKNDLRREFDKVFKDLKEMKAVGVDGHSVKLLDF